MRPPDAWLFRVVSNVPQEYFAGPFKRKSGNIEHPNGIARVQLLTIGRDRTLGDEKKAIPF